MRDEKKLINDEINYAIGIVVAKYLHKCEVITLDELEIITKKLKEMYNPATLMLEGEYE